MKISVADIPGLETFRHLSYSYSLEYFRLIFPTLKIFYYNYLIQKENRNHAYSFIKTDEQ